MTGLGPSVTYCEREPQMTPLSTTFVIVLSPICGDHLRNACLRTIRVMPILIPQDKLVSLIQMDFICITLWSHIHITKLLIHFLDWFGSNDFIKAALVFRVCVFKNIELKYSVLAHYIKHETRNNPTKIKIIKVHEILIVVYSSLKCHQWMSVRIISFSKHSADIHSLIKP